MFYIGDHPFFFNELEGKKILLGKFLTFKYQLWIDNGHTSAFALCQKRILADSLSEKIKGM